MFFDKDAARTNGIIFTPTYVSDYINEELFKDATPTSTVCDFSCGAGEFLISALKQFKKWFPALSRIEIIENNLYGADILEENVYCTKLFLTLYSLYFNEDKDVIAFNIINADSTQPNVLPKFHSYRVQNGFDFIIGNPPYVRIQDMDKDQRTMLKQHFKTCNSGSFNLFYAFIELSCQSLREDGKMGYIIPNHLFKMKSAQPLRELLINDQVITKVIDFKDNQLFENAQTYSAIVFFDKAPKHYMYYKTIDERFNNMDIHQYLNSREWEKVPYSGLDAEAIHLLSAKDYNNVTKIENQPYLLDISTGIATQKDKLYMIDITQSMNKNENDPFYYKEYNGKLHKIEKGITMSIIKGSGDKKVDLTTNFYEFNKIIYPYNIKNGKASLISEKTMADVYPHTLAYFKAIKRELNKRNGGNPSTKAWYEYGRSQALHSFVPKIIFPTNSGKPNFAYFNDFALFHNGYAIYGLKNNKEGMDLPLLTKILNSKIMDYYIQLTSYMISGGYYCYQKKYLENFTIPDFSEEEKQYLKSMTSKDVIDEFLIQKYGLER
ncbi:Eco57I restriction-modification methylase domain-containing protein [Lentibacillus halophilus]